MKKILFLLFVSAFITFSCTDDTSKSTDITGTWVREKISVYNIQTSSAQAKKFIDTDIKSYNKRARDKYIFSENGFVQFVDTAYADESMFDVTDTTIVFGYSSGENVVVPISLAGNKLSLFTDETEYYQDWINFLFPEKKIEVSRVITKYTYQKK